MGDYLENIRRAMEKIDAAPLGSRERMDATLEAIQASPLYTVRALLEERDALSAALEAAREDAWQPIGTAPKDGTRIMLGNEHGAWVADWRPVYQSGYRPDNPWASSMLNHWHIASEHRHKRATHWRPLPKPPAIDQALGKENRNG